MTWFQLAERRFQQYLRSTGRSQKLVSQYRYLLANSPQSKDYSHEAAPLPLCRVLFQLENTDF